MMKLSRDEAKTLMIILVDYRDDTIKCHCLAEDSFRRCTYSVITLYDTYIITSPIKARFKCPCGGYTKKFQHLAAQINGAVVVFLEKRKFKANIDFQWTVALN